MSCSSAARRRSLHAPPRRRRAWRRRSRRSCWRGRSAGRSTATSRRSRRRTRRRCGRGGRRRRAAAGPRAPTAEMSGSASESQNASSSQARRRACRPAPGRTSPRCASWPSPQAAATPPAAWKISTVWARQTMRASSGISSPRRPRGWPRPSQCSSSARIASAVSVVRPIRSAISAPRSQRACISERVTSPSSLIALQPPAAVAQRPVGRDRAQRPHEGGQLAGPVDALGRALGDVVVGAEQRRHAGGVRRAAGVLEQQRVEQVGAGRWRRARAPARAACRSGTSGARGRAARPRSGRARRRARRRPRTAGSKRYPHPWRGVSHQCCRRAASRDHLGATARREGDVAPRDPLRRPRRRPQRPPPRIAASATRISISAKAAPRQRRTPPPNGIHA